MSSFLKKHIITILSILILLSCKNISKNSSFTEVEDMINIKCDSFSKKAENDFRNGKRIYSIMGTVYLTVDCNLNQPITTKLP